MLTIIFLISLIIFPLYASAYTYNIPFRNISRKDGLNDLTVSALFKDSKGYMWIGTATSIEQFDGMYMTHYPFPGNDNKSKWVNDIKESPWGTILAGNENGLWEKREDSFVPLYPDSIKGIVRKIIPDESGNIYVSSGKGIWLCNSSKILRHIILDTTPVFGNNEVISFCFNGDCLWAVTSNVLYKVSTKDFKVERYSDDSFIRNDLHSYREIVSIGDKLYIATLGDGIHTFETETNSFGRFINVGSNVINDLTSDGKDVLHIATDGNGVVFASASENRILNIFRNNINNSESLHSNSTYSVLLDRDGLLWVGLHQLGLDLCAFNTGIFTLYEIPAKFTTRNIPVRAISIEDNEKIICSRNGLYYIDEEKEEVIRVQTPQIRSNTVLCCRKIGEVYYFGTYGGGMYVFDPRNNVTSDFTWEKSDDFVSISVFDINVDSENRVWVSTSSGLYCYKEKKLLYHFTEKNSKIKSSVVYSVFFDSTGKGWICTDKGLLIWEPCAEKLITGVFPEGFVDGSKIKSIYEDSEHNLYFILDKGNLFVSDLNFKKFRYIDDLSVISDKELSFIVEDDDKLLWLGTNDGLYRYDRKDFIRSYGRYDGVPSQIFLSCQPVKDKNGNLWFGNSSGLLFLDKEGKTGNIDKTYRLRINRIFSEYEDVTETLDIKENESGYVLRMDATLRGARICFTDFTYVGQDQIYYEYKIGDSEWKLLKGVPSILLNNLMPGSKRIEIRRLSMPSTSVVVTINVHTPIYVYCVAGLIIIFFCYIIYRRKNRNTVIVPVSEITVTENTSADAVPISEKKETVKSEPQKYIHLSEEECKSICEKLDDVMQKERLFTNPDLKLNDLASAAGVSIYNLSYILNHFLNSNFYDYTNNFRIKEFEKLIESGEQSKYTMNALIEMCGFSSRSSFFRYFKKVTGMSPGEYIKKHFKEEE